MKKRLGNLRERTRRDNRGLSLVEVMCAVAILALVSGIIGTVIVMSTRTYRRGISETGIQQEAQLAANSIGNLVKDACGVVYKDKNVWYENGEKIKNDDMSDKKLDSGLSYDSELTIKTNDNRQHTVRYYPPKTDLSGVTKAGTLQYIEGIDEDGAQTIAGNILDFSADTEGFKTSRTIQIDIKVRDFATGREIPLSYKMKSRNDAIEGFEYVEIPDRVSIYFPLKEVVLVPGEEYTIPFEVSGTVAEAGFEFEGGTDSWGVGEPSSEDGAKVKVPIDTKEVKKKVTIRTKAKKSDGSPMARESCYILVRRVKSVSVSHTVDTKNAAGGMRESAGAVYTFSAAVTGDELAQRSDSYNGHSYDDNYKPAQQVVWSCILDLKDGTGSKEYQYVENGSGVASNNFDTEPFSKYFEKTDIKEGTQFPSLTLKVIEALPTDMELIVRATSQHTLGVNKADSRYYDVYGADPKGVYYGEDKIEPRDTIMTQEFEITLEPFEEGIVKLNTKGGRPTAADVTFDFSDDRTDSTGTTAKYVPADDAVKIILGKDEKGSGAGGETPYTFKVGVKVKDELKTTITVHVRRVDYVHIDPVLNKDDNQTMDLRLRFNADKKDDNLIKYLVDGEKQDETGNLLNKALSVRVTIEVLGKNGSVRSGLTQIAEWGTYAADSRDKNKENSNEEIIKLVEGKWRTQLRVGEDGKEISDKDYNNKKSEAYKKSKVIYQLENTKPARIKGSGTSWTLEQTPELDIKPLALGEGEKIKVTMEALHPAGNNNANQEYKKDVLDVYILDGQEVINVAKQRIVVEPYQVKGSGNGPMVIPVHVSPSVGAIKVKLEGHEKATNGAALTKVSENNNVSGGINDEWTVVRPADGKNVMNLELDISRSEEGALYDGKNGRIKMTLEAYTDNTLSEFLESTWAYLEVRRVTKVEISENSKKNFKNEVGKEIVLTAQASGIQGTEYFERQKKEGTDKFDPVWDQGDKYKSPYKLRWSLYHKENGKEFEKTISDDYSEYFSNVNSSEDGNGNQTIKFTLNKPLPVGWEIRATSEHVGDKNGKAENRSGLNYVKDIDKYKKAYPEGIVFDYIKVQDSLIVADGFKRGKSYEFIKAVDIVNMQQDVFGWWTCLEQASFYRYRETGGAWSKYHMMDSKQGNWAVANYVPMSYLFRPDKEYEIEIVSVVYNKTDKLIYWPLDKELLEKGRGWLEAGFSFWNPTQEQWKKDHPDASQYYRDYPWYKECYDKVQKIPEVKQSFLIPKSEMSFCTNKDASSKKFLTVSNKVTSVGSETKPIQLNGNYEDKSDYQGFIVDLEITGYEQNTDQNCFRTIVQKKSDNQWITLGYDDESVIHEKEGFKVDSGNPYISIYKTANAQGLYRVVPVILAGEKTGGKIKWRDVTEIPRSDHTDMDILFNPEYTTTEESYHLYDYNTGRYVIYFEFYR